MERFSPRQSRPVSRVTDGRVPFGGVGSHVRTGSFAAGTAFGMGHDRERLRPPVAQLT